MFDSLVAFLKDYFEKAFFKSVNSKKACKIIQHAVLNQLVLDNRKYVKESLYVTWILLTQAIYQKQGASHLFGINLMNSHMIFNVAVLNRHKHIYCLKSFSFNIMRAEKPDVNNNDANQNVRVQYQSLY